MTTKSSAPRASRPQGLPEPGTPAAELLLRLAHSLRHGSAPARPPVRHAPPPPAGPPHGTADLLRHLPREQLESVRRCHYRDSAGRRCRRDRMHNHPTYCFFHARPEGVSDLPPDRPFAPANGAGSADTTLEDLLGPLQDYRTAAGVNFTLGRLLLLVADNRISARKAHLIAYICRILLQSIPAVAREIGAAGLNEDDREDLVRAIRATRFLFEYPDPEDNSNVRAPAPAAEAPKAPQPTSP